MGEDEEGEDFIFYGTPIEREEDTSARKRKSIADAGQLRSLPAWKQEKKMGEDEEGEDFIFYGTPIEREEDMSARKRKPFANAGQLRSLLASKQEVRDEEGRRRFHGAFTGGYSAGYYNTVGSKEGWAPQTFTSSRKNRAEAKKQSIYNFLDDEDMKVMGGHALETSSQFDTFGFTAAEVARKQAEKEQQKRPSAIPGPVPDEIVLPATNSIGVKLLVKMGWRVGHAIKEANANSLYDARREARKAFLAFSGNEENSEPSAVELSNNDLRNISERCDDNAAASQSTPVYVLHPKQDLHGLGYDPFKHAPEFRDRKRLRDSRSNDKGSKTDVSTRSKLSGKYAPGFGIGALEELDIEDEDIYASGFDYIGTEVEEEEPSRVITDNKLKLGYRKKGVLSGFKVASSSDYNLERFHPPVIPPDFEPYHKFTSPPETLDEFTESPPPEVPPPEDNSLRLLIDGFATLVARCGKLFEDLSKEKNKSNPLFSFLSGGKGHEYYARKLWEAKKKSVQPRQEVHTPSDRKMTAESRGKILGEKPLDRSTNDSTTSVAHKEVVLQSNLTDTFTKPKSAVDFSERAKPFGDDPAKQERFEQFLKDRYQGGLRSTYAGSTSSMSDNDRARERLDFEAAAAAIEKGEWKTKTNIPSSLHVIDLLGRDDRFISSSSVEKHQILKVEEKVDKLYPKREEFQWRPSPILCKRFDLIDPFMGKPPPAPRARSKLDTLIFMPDSFPNVKSAETDAKRDSLSTSQSEPQESEKIEDPDVETDTTRVQRPVDLYKAIFSDDSDDEVDNASISNNVAEDPEKKIDGVNKTLNRLVAGDFLESLGKELGLEVPPVNTNSSCTLTETTNGTNGTSLNNEKSAQMEDDKIDESLNIIGTNSATHADTRRTDRSSSPTKSDGKEGKSKAERKEHRSKKHRSHSRHHTYSSTSDSGSSSDHEYYDRSTSRSKRKSRRHSDRHRHKKSRSPRYSSRDKDRDQSDDGRMDRKSRDREKHYRKKYC